MAELIRHVGIFVIAAIVVAVVLYLVILAVRSYLGVRHVDRETYFLCDRHGAIRAKDMLTVLDDGAGPPIEVCPVCYTEKLKDARAKAATSTKIRSSN